MVPNKNSVNAWQRNWLHLFIQQTFIAGLHRPESYLITWEKLVNKIMALLGISEFHPEILILVIYQRNTKCLLI